MLQSIYLNNEEVASFSHNGVTFLEKIFGKRFQNDEDTKTTLENVAKLIFDDKWMREVAGKCEENVEKRKEEEQRDKVDEMCRWLGSDESLEQLERNHDQMGDGSLKDSQEEVRIAEGQYGKADEMHYLFNSDGSLEQLERSDDKIEEKKELGKVTKEKEKEKNLLIKQKHFLKGSLAEAAVQCILKCFQVPMICQVPFGGRIVDVMTWPDKRVVNPGWIMLHETKCVDRLQSHDLEQLRGYLSFNASSPSRNKYIICYHFFRLLRHQHAGFKTWKEDVKKKLIKYCKDSDVPVVALFYEKPLLSRKLCDVLDMYCEFESCTAAELLRSAALEFVNESVKFVIESVKFVIASEDFKKTVNDFLTTP